jgi:hypothetical protein
LASNRFAETKNYHVENYRVENYRVAQFAVHVSPPLAS